MRWVLIVWLSSGSIITLNDYTDEASCKEAFDKITAAAGELKAFCVPGKTPLSGPSCIGPGCAILIPPPNSVYPVMPWWVPR